MKRFTAMLTLILMGCGTTHTLDSALDGEAGRQSCENLYGSTGCSRSLRANKVRYDYTFGEESLKRFGKFDGGRSFLIKGDNVIVSIPFTNAKAFELLVDVDINYLELQTRQQKWRRCGRLGLERCRHWVDDGRDNLIVVPQLVDNGNVVSQNSYNTNLLPASEWVTNASQFSSLHGNVELLAAGPVAINAIPFLGGKKLNRQVRRFEGSQITTLRTTLAGGQKHDVVLRISVGGQGAASVGTFKVSLQEL